MYFLSTQQNYLYFCFEKFIRCMEPSEPQQLTTTGDPSSNKTESTSTTAFRLNCVRLFLTYPKCNLAPAEALELLRSKIDFENYVIARETHQDGSFHLHAYLHRGEGKRFNIRNPARLDLLGHHGNYQAVRNPKQVLKYVTKEGCFVTNLTDAELSDTGSPNPIANLIQAVQTGQMTIPEAMDSLILTKTGARDFLLNRERILRTFHEIAPPDCPILHQLSEFPDVPQALQDFDFKTALLLWGPAGTGKTSLALALVGTPYLLVTNEDAQKKWDPWKYKGIVYDDFKPKRDLTEEEWIHILDVSRTLTVAARFADAYLTSGRRVAITSNRNPNVLLPLHLGQIKRRVTIYYVPKLGVYELQQSVDNVPQHVE